MLTERVTPQHVWRLMGQIEVAAWYADGEILYRNALPVWRRFAIDRFCRAVAVCAYLASPAEADT